MNSSNCQTTGTWLVVGCGPTLDYRPSYVPSRKSICGKLCAALISCLLDAAMLQILWFVSPWCEVWWLVKESVFSVTDFWLSVLSILLASALLLLVTVLEGDADVWLCHCEICTWSPARKIPLSPVNIGITANDVGTGLLSCIVLALFWILKKCNHTVVQG